MPVVAIYARYSSDHQRDASIDDQVRLCRERALREGWTLGPVYSDAAISGSSLILRPSIQQMMQDAMAKKFDVVMAEALDRLSRDQEEIAGVYKRLGFFGIPMFTLTEGAISELHIGLKGTMNALMLKDLAEKTRRGLRGRIEDGKSGGGNAYGYDIVRRVGADGEYARGERTINLEQTEIVRGIFADYIKGISPRAIATALNRRGVSAPTGGQWGASTIYGNRERGTGILNNELYIGQLVWNRLRYVTNPDTGKRVSRLNPESEVIRHDVPELRIIDQETWDRVKAMQGEYNKRETPLWTKNRPRSLLSKLGTCGCCGGGFTIMSGDRLGCAASRNKGTCDNRLTIKRQELEAAVLGALQDHLMEPELCAEFCKAYTARLNQLRIEHNAALAGYKVELVKLEREREQIIKSILDGVPGRLLAERSHALQDRFDEVEALIATTTEAPVLFHPNMASKYHQEIRSLISTLGQEDRWHEAGRVLRSLISRIVLTPRADRSGLTVDLIGDLAGILSIATSRGGTSVRDELSKFNQVDVTSSDDMLASIARAQKSTAPGSLFEEDSRAVLAMVAGAGFEPTTFRL